MSQITMIYNQEQWNQLVQSMRAQNQNSIQEVMLPLNNIQQKNPISISNNSIYRLDQAITDSIPQNIQFNFSNKGFFNNYNSNLSFNIPIHITGLPSYDKATGYFDLYIDRYSAYVAEDTPGVPNDYISYDTKLFKGTNSRITYQIVLYNNYICLLTHLEGHNEENGIDDMTSVNYLVRLYKIPPTPAAYLDNVLIQKNNHSNNAFNDMYKDIFRKQAVSNQIIEQNFSDFMQQQYAYVSHNQDVTIPDQRRPFTVNGDQIKILAEYTSTANSPITEITYNYQVSIPLVYFHPFFQMAYNTPMELLNEGISMIMNFNLPIFSACYGYQKNGITDNDNHVNFNDMLTVTLEGINDMKIILYKDAVMNYRTIEQSKNGIYYLIYRNSDYAQYQRFSKYDNIVLQNVIPKLNSLDIIQLSLFDKKQYVIDPQQKTKQINNMDYYLGYSSLFNDQRYQNYYGKEWMFDISQLQLYGHDTDLVQLSTNFRLQYTQSDAQVFMTSLGDIQLSIDDRNIIPYTYQKLEDIYKTNISLFDISDNKFAPNAHWDYPYYLKYFNTYIYKFDQKYGQKQQLQQPQFKGLTVSDAKSNIFCKLYNYNTGENPPVPVQYKDFDPAVNQGFYNPRSDRLATDSKAWIDTDLFCEFIYFYSSLFMIAGGDLMQISEQETANILKNIPFYNETDYKVAQALPLFIKLAKDDLQNEIMSNIIAKIREGNISLQISRDEMSGKQSAAEEQMVEQNAGGPSVIPPEREPGSVPMENMGEGTGLKK